MKIFSRKGAETQRKKGFWISGFLKLCALAALRENLFGQVVDGADDAVTHERCAEVQ
jgi:hypothetical protein